MTGDLKENAIEFFTGKKTACVSFTQQRYISRIKKLAKEYPDECKIQAINKDGSICANIPVSWVKISPPRQVNISDERRKELSDMMKRISRESKTHSTK